MDDYFSTIADDIGPANDATYSTLREHERIQAIVNQKLSIDDDQSFYFKELPVADDAKTLKDIDPRKAPEWDTIPPKAFKIAAISFICISLHLCICKFFLLNFCSLFC